MVHVQPEPRLHMPDSGILSHRRLLRLPQLRIQSRQEAVSPGDAKQLLDRSDVTGAKALSVPPGETKKRIDKNISESKFPPSATERNDFECTMHDCKVRSTVKKAKVNKQTKIYRTFEHQLHEKGSYS